MTKSFLGLTDLKLLIALQEQPTAPYSSLAEKVSLSPQTVSHRLQRLRERGHGEVKAILDGDALNFEYVNVLLEVPSLDKIPIIETFAKNYPYVRYRSRCFGGFNGVYLQFRIPKGSRDAIFDVLERLKGAGLIRKKYEIPTIGRSIYTKPQLAFWNPEDLEWEFSWFEWMNGEPSEANSSFDKNKLAEKARRDVILDKLDYIDLYILRHLTIDARQKQRQITKEVNKGTSSQIPPQRISERLRFLMEHAVRDYKVLIKWSVLDIYNTVLFLCETSPSTVEDFKKQLIENPPPFATTFYTTTNGFMWVITSPSSHLSGLTSILTEKVSALSLNILDTRHTRLYWFRPENYDQETKNWKISEAFMIDKPLASIGIGM
ncbi:MAG: AsnC family transcriptional regulator [Candidatus Hodarchaeota archaeon]